MAGELGRKVGAIAKGYGVPLGDNENVLKLIVEIIAQLCENMKVH